MIRRSPISRFMVAGLGVVAALTLASCGEKKAAAPAAKDTIVFSILSTESAQNMESYWKPILADMETSTGMKVKPFFSSNYSSLIVAMGAKQTDVGWFSNASGLEAVRRSGGEVFARTFDPSGTDGYKSVIIVPKDSKLNSIQDLLKCDKTLDFGIGDKKSTSGTLAPMTYVFIPANKKPEACFKTVLSASHDANLFAVANHKLDAATNNSTALSLNRLAKGGAQADKVKVIWESPTLPEDPIVWRKDLDPVIKEKLRQFFLTYGQGDTPVAAQQRLNLKRLSMGGFKPADDTHLLVVREMEALEQVGLARDAGDQAKLAAAEKTLADIKAQRVVAEGKAGVAAPANSIGASQLAMNDLIPPPPSKPISARAFDLLLWGGVIALLVLSFKPAEIDKFPQLFSDADKMQGFASGFFSPFTDPKAFMAADWELYVGKMWQTIQMALWGTALAIVVAIPLGLLGARNISPWWIQQPVRRLLDLIRSIPDLVVALIFITAVGLGPFAGVMALMFNTGGVLAKLFAEAVESIDKGPVEGVRATGAVKLQEVVWGVIPQVAPLWTSYALYRFESSSRSATVLGLIGAGGVGQVLLDSINGFQYDQTGCIVLVIVVAVSLIDLLSQIIRTRLL